MDSLTEIGKDQTFHLIQSLEADFPKGVHAYNYIKTAMEWGNKKPDYNVLVLAPFGDFSDKTFILHTRVLGAFCGTAYSGSERGLERLGRALRETNRINWKGSWSFTCMEGAVGEVVNKVAQEKSDEINVHHNAVFCLTQETLKPLLQRPRCEGFKFVDMSVEDFELVNANWAHRTSLLDSLVMDTLRLNGGVGLAPEGPGQGPVSWALATFYGGIGFVWTEPGWRGRGLASASVLQLASQLSTSHIHLSVLEGNIQAEAFFHALGLQCLPRHTWIYRRFFG